MLNYCRDKMKARAVVGMGKKGPRYVTPDLTYDWEGAREQYEDNKWHDNKKKVGTGVRFAFDAVASDSLFFFSLVFLFLIFPSLFFLFLTFAFLLFPSLDSRFIFFLLFVLCLCKKLSFDDDCSLWVGIMILTIQKLGRLSFFRSSVVSYIFAVHFFGFLVFPVFFFSIFPFVKFPFVKFPFSKVPVSYVSFRLLLPFSKFHRSTTTALFG